MQEDKSLLTTQEVADLVGLSAYTIAKYRTKGMGPKYLLIGKKTIRYKKADVEAWIELIEQEKEI